MQSTMIITSVEPQPGDTHDEKTTREALQLGVDGLEMLLGSLAHNLRQNIPELDNFDSPALVYHLQECVKILQEATGA